MKLFLIHVGFYDPYIIEGLYEQHSNYFVVAENKELALQKAKEKSGNNITEDQFYIHFDWKYWPSKKKCKEIMDNTIKKIKN